MRMRRTAVVVALAAAVTVTGGTAAYAHNGGGKDRKPRPADSAKPKPGESAKPKPKPSTSTSPAAKPIKLLTPFHATGTLDAVDLVAGTITVDADSGTADVRGKDVTVKIPKIAKVLLNGKSVLPGALTAGLKVSVNGLRSENEYTAALVTAGLKLGTKPTPAPTPTPTPTATTASPAPTVTVTVTTTQTVTPSPTQTEP